MQPKNHRVREGQYGAELEVTLIDTDSPWSPYYSLEDALKLERVEEALRRGNVEAASREAKVFELKSAAAE